MSDEDMFTAPTPRSIDSRGVNISHAALLGPSRPQPSKIWKTRFVKVLVVGDSGLGKTTLISSLVSTPGEHLEVGCCTLLLILIIDMDCHSRVNLYTGSTQ